MQTLIFESLTGIVLFAIWAVVVVLTITTVFKVLAAIKQNLTVEELVSKFQNRAIGLLVIICVGVFITVNESSYKPKSVIHSSTKVTIERQPINENTEPMTPLWDW